MTLRELIAKLESIEAQHGGELEVRYVCNEYGPTEILSVRVEDHSYVSWPRPREAPPVRVKRERVILE